MKEKDNTNIMVDIEKKIEKVNGAMSQEDMPLTVEDIEVLKKCMMGTSTYEKERQKVLERVKNHGKKL